MESTDFRSRSPSPTLYREEPIRSANSSCGNYILVALGVITLIGSLVATGLLYSQLGYTAFAIGGSGIILSVATFLLSRYCCVRKSLESPKDDSKQTKLHLEEEEETLPPFLQPLNLETEKRTSPSVEEEKSTSQGTESTKKEVTENPPPPENTLTALLHFELADSELNPARKNIPPELLSIPICVWLGLVKPDLDVAKIINDVKFAVFKTIIDQDLDTLDRKIHLKKRLERLGHPTHLLIKDMIPSWKESPLRIGLMMDEELAALKVSDIENIDHGMVGRVVGSRIPLLTPQEYDTIMIGSIDDIKSFNLGDLCKLTADQISKVMGFMPSIAFLLIKDEELKKIDLSQLTEAQLTCLFASNRLHTLLPAQINACVEKITDKRLFAGLSNTQIEEFDPKKMDENIFKGIFSMQEAAKRFPALSLECLYQYSELLSEEHWRLIGEKHALALDFSKVKESQLLKKQAIFNCLFTAFYVPLMNKNEMLLAHVYALSEFFLKEHWEKVPAGLAGQLDITKIAEKNQQAAFDVFFDISFKGVGTMRLENLSADQINTYHKFFKEGHWKGVKEATALEFASKGYLQNIEKTKQPGVFTLLFPVPFNDETDSRLVKLGLDVIYTLSPLFSQDQWKHIGDAHKSAFDFTKIEVNKQKEVFNGIFQDAALGVYSSCHRVFAKLPLEKIYALSGFFTKEHCTCLKKALSSENSQAFDFDKVADTTRDTFKQVFQNPF